MHEIQTMLRDLGFDPGPIDGVCGPRTIAAMRAALGVIGRAEPSSVIPDDWMPNARMQRIVAHWTAGGPRASEVDCEHYHLIIEADGNLVRGDHEIDDNAAPIDLHDYASHTLNGNTGAIGVALCGMMDAQERPFRPGPYPINEIQWAVLGRVLAQLCRRYRIAPDRQSVLTHAEVQPTLGIVQRGKWDIARLPWRSDISGPIVIGDDLRALVREEMRK